MTRSALLASLVLAACSPEIEGGLFDSVGSPPASTTVASGAGDDRSDDDTTADASSDDGDGDGDGDGTSGPTPTSVETSSAQTGPDPTFGELEDSGDDGVGSTGESTTGADPTGVDPTGVDPSGGGGDCCTEQVVPGCDDPNIEACVCGFDDYCCSTEWDALCVDAAADCGGGCVGGGGAAQCCFAQFLPGCGDAAIEACVCGFDGFCCDVEWDELCAAAAGDCGAPC